MTLDPSKSTIYHYVADACVLEQALRSGKSLLFVIPQAALPNNHRVELQYSIHRRFTVSWHREAEAKLRHAQTRGAHPSF